MNSPYLSRIAVVTTVVVAMLCTLSLSAQITGSTAPGQQLPTTVEPASLAGSNFGGDVNLFTGTYNGSYQLGGVSTPGGLSYTLGLSYSSQTIAGNQPGISTGIPYGEGWSLNVPTVSVSSEAFQSFRLGQLGMCDYFNKQLDPHDNLRLDVRDGALYWFAPVLSIPGVDGGRMVFKEYDGNTAVFVCNQFSDYVELRLDGSSWEAHLSDGTVYEFRLAKKSYRNANNQRVLEYGTGIQTRSGDNTVMAWSQSERVAQQTLPKGEFLTWYCTKIRHKNLPNNQNISFHYETFGKFNYFKEFSEQWQHMLAVSLTEEFSAPPGEAFELPINQPNLEVFTDVLLVRVQSSDGFTPMHRIDLNYETATEHFGAGTNLLDWRFSDVFRKDSLYSYEQVYYRGTYGQSSAAYKPLSGSATSFGNDWKRYLHGKHDDVVSFNQTGALHMRNPYLVTNGGDYNYYWKNAGNGNELAFDHGYLESERIASGIIPGDLYELRTVLTGDFCNYDIQVVTGSDPTLSYGSEPGGVKSVEPLDYNYYAGQKLFSTQPNGIKWNTAGNGSNLVVTSNLFSMPNLPSGFGGINIQVGPANSDNVWNLPFEHIIDGTTSSDPPDGGISFDHNIELTGINYSSTNLLKTIQRVPQNFGAGYPWYQLTKAYDRLMPYNDLSPLFTQWWNDDQDATYGWDNEPTLAGPNSDLKAVELIRYSKNPWMLVSVDQYTFNGIWAGEGLSDGKVLAARQELTYDMEQRPIVNNRNYSYGESPEYVSGLNQNVFLLAGIRQVPVNPSRNPEYDTLVYDPATVPTVHFDYANYGETVLDTFVIGFTVDSVSGVRDTTFHYGSIFHSQPGRLLSRITNHLGGTTNIEYYPRSSGNPTIAVNRRLNYQACIDPQAATPALPPARVIEMNYAVKSVTVEDGVADQQTDYAYSGFQSKDLVPGLNTQHFDKTYLEYRYGFTNTMVTQPEVNGNRPYTEYTHFTDYHRFGKLQLVEAYSDGGDLQQKSTFEYSLVHAFRNGVVRPEYRKAGRAWDYIDWHDEFDAYRPPQLTIDSLSEAIKPLPSMALFTAPRAGLHSYYALNPGEALAAPSYYDSYFVRLDKEVTERFEVAGCNPPTTAPVFNWDSLKQSDYPDIKAYQNTATDPDVPGLIALMKSSYLQRPVEQALLTETPLSDSVLLYAIAEPMVSAAALTTVLLNQPGLSDSVLANLFERPGYDDASLREVLLNLPHDISDGALRDFIGRYRLKAPEGSIAEDVLLKQPYLLEHQQLLLTEADHQIDASTVAAALQQQDYRPDTVLLSLLQNELPVGDASLIELIEYRWPYPGDAVLVAIANTQSEQVVQAVMTNSPDTLSTAVWNALNGRDFRADLIELIGKIDAGKHQQAIPPLREQCTGTVPSELSIATITEYDYFDCDYTGTTTSEGWRQLLGVDHDTIRLKWEPSWKRYKTTSYSPQYTAAFSADEQFYYYDLENRYKRYIEHYPGSSFSTDYDTLFTGTLTGSVLVDSNWNGALQIWVPVVETQYQIDTTFVPIVTGSGGNEYIGPLADGRTKAREKGLRNLTFQSRVSSKNNRDADPLLRSEYYLYDARWNAVAPKVQVTDTLPTDTACNPWLLWDTSEPVDSFPAECSEYELVAAGYYPNVPPGYGVYYLYDTVYFYYEYVPGGDTNLVSVPGPDGSYWMCPLQSLDTTDAYINLLFSNLTTVEDTLSGDGQRQPLLTNRLKNFLFLRDVVAQVDTVPNAGYRGLPGDFEPLLDFWEPGGTDANGFVLVNEEYPFDSLRTARVLTRNWYGQVALEQNVNGLQTRYHYAPRQYVWHWDSLCHANSYSGTNNAHPGAPHAVTVGVGLPDSLFTQYSYHPDVSVASVTDPNGTVAAFEYDEYGRLEHTFKNGVPVSANDYSWWPNDTTIGFDSMATYNFVETALFLEDNEPLAEVGWAWLDPLGRSYHAASQIQSDYLNGPGGAASEQVMAHTGLLEYDAWNRETKSYKPFLHDPGSLVPRGVRRTSTNSQYPVAATEMAYENDQFARPLKTARPGESLTGHTVDLEYELVTGSCLVCELGIDDVLAYELMTDTLDEYVFSRVRTTDEDSKEAIEFTNALGQTVASLAWSDTTAHTTLFFYDSYGNIEKVVNPEGQASLYRYNMRGQLFEKETVDGGSTKYMYSKSGQVVLTQDANGAAGLHHGSDTVPYYRQFVYDAYDRLLTQQKVRVFQRDRLDPLAYESFEYGTFLQDADWEKYTFTNSSTYAWMASASVSDGGFPVPEEEAFQLWSNLGFPVLEKQYYYNDINDAQTSLPAGIADTTVHANMLPLLSGTVPRYGRGRLSHTVVYDNALTNSSHVAAPTGQLPVQRCFYGYNPDGELAWQLEQFNPNRISADAKGLVARIDYPQYNTRGAVRTQNIDINNDSLQELQYHYVYDGYNRLHEVFLNVNDARESGNLVARFHYDDALGLLLKTEYFRPCSYDSGRTVPVFVDTNLLVDVIDYSYDVRNRLTDINSLFYDQQLYYDGQGVTAAGSIVLDAHTNYNGNINGVQHAYSLAQAINNPGNFSQPTWYGFEYDGLNRLTHADAYVGDFVNAGGQVAAQFGDAEFGFDRIGNFTELTRYLQTATGTVADRQQWTYSYLQGTNRLLGVADGYGSDNRAYTYDGAGNLQTDDFRSLHKTVYGRANLPFALSTGTHRINYLYNANDLRIYKGKSNNNVIKPAPTAEYYLRDHAGRELGVLDMNAGDWSWWAFGNDRFARFKPDSLQQPVFYAGDLGNESIVAPLDDEPVEIKNKLDDHERDGYTYPVKLISILYESGLVKIITERELNDQLLADPNMEYEIQQEANLKSPEELLVWSGKYGEQAVLRADGLYRAGPSLDSLQTDSTLLDSTGRYYATTSLEDLVYYVHDHLGNTRVTYTPLTNCLYDFQLERFDQNLTYELQNVVDYYPYGKALREYQNSAGAEKYLTTHHERDRETGFDYRGARFYDGDVGRFLSLDPLAANYVAWNGYHYVLDRPTIYTDPSGQSAICPTCPDDSKFDVFRNSTREFEYNPDDGTVSRSDVLQQGAENTTRWLGYTGARSAQLRMQYDKATQLLDPTDSKGRTQLKLKTRAQTPALMQAIIEEARPSSAELNKTGGSANKSNAKWNKAGEIAGKVGRPLVVLNVLSSGNRIANAEDKTKAVATEAGGWGGAILGGELGASAGTSLGPYGAAIIGLLGATVGGIGGEEAVKSMMEQDNKGPMTPIYICFTAGTKIAMADGSDKNIEDVRSGEFVQSYDPVNKVVEPQEVILVQESYTHSLVQIRFSDGTINENTPTHPYFVVGKGWASFDRVEAIAKYDINVEALEINDRVLKLEGDKVIEIKVESITVLEKTTRTFNLSNVKKNHNFFANGILVHNRS